ncbi:MAG TPA: hypothetical protein VFT91_04775, partial [Dehalococcoidia bacterium]|nr:hypothetical protein [Dehalococcoidia bacterium]
IEQLSPTLKRRSHDWPDDDVEAVERVMEKALHRARGAILLDRVQELAGVTFNIQVADNFADRSEVYLRGVVLNAFKRVCKQEPWQQGRIDFDDIGIALMEDVRPEEVDYILARLQGDGLVEMAGVRQEPGYRFYKPTPAGLAEADRLAIPERAPGLLLEEIIAGVESTLTTHKPELAESLRRQSLRVAEAREMDEHEVGEVAQACEQIIWDFLDLDVFWEGVSEGRPPRNNTRDRVRLLLRATAPSETERDLIQALEQYIVGWFGQLEQFVHRHRHLPGQSERAHAKRMVVYTYMFLGDLIEVLGV